jgi:VWFA-related protein
MERVHMSMRSRSRLRCCSPAASLMLLLIAGPGLSLAQTKPTREPPVFGSGVSVIALPVFVMDKNGKAIQGLTADAFEVEERGRKVPIIAFQAIDAGAPDVLPTAGNVTRLAARRQFLFLFDLSFSTIAGIQRARESAIEFAGNGLAPADLAAVATFSTAGVKVLLGFSPDREQLAKAIESLGAISRERPPDPLALAYDISFTPADQRGGATAETPAQARMEEFLKDQLGLLDRSDRRQYGDRVDGFLAGLQQLASALDAVQGRKQVILLSAGFDPSVLMGAQGEKAQENTRAVVEGRLWEVDSSSHFGDNVAQNRMQQVFTVLAATDTVVHSVDVAGLAAGGSLDSTGRPGSIGRGRESLAQLSLNSGGRFIKDTNNLGQALQEVLDASRYYYILAFEPAAPAKKKQELRKLKVRVKAAGAEVSHRAAYVVPDPDAVDPGKRQMQAAEVIAKGLSGGAIGLRAVAVPYREAQGALRLPLLLEIDGKSLLEGVKKPVQLEIYGYAFDEQGRIRDVVTLTPTLDPAKLGAAFKEKGVQVLTSFQTAAGKNDLRFLVRDAASGRAGALRIEVEVPAFASDRLALSPPLFMDDPRARLVLPSPSRGNPKLEIPFRLEDAAFTLDARPVLKNGAAREVCVMSFMGPRYVTDSGFEIQSELVNAAGQALALPAQPPRIVKDADGFQRFVLKLEPKGAGAGDYELRVSFKDPKSGSAATSTQSVRVE